MIPKEPKLAFPVDCAAHLQTRVDIFELEQNQQFTVGARVCLLGKYS